MLCANTLTANKFCQMAHYMFFPQEFPSLLETSIFLWTVQVCLLQPHNRAPGAWELVMSKKAILCSVLWSFFVLVTNIQYLKAKKNVSFAFLKSKPIVKRRMVSEDLIFTSSSDSEDSKVNFIADYMLEVEGSPNSSNQDGEDSDKELEAYADKMLVDHEWLAIHVYEEERKTVTDEELEKQLQY